MRQEERDGHHDTSWHGGSNLSDHTLNLFTCQRIWSRVKWLDMTRSHKRQASLKCFALSAAWRDEVDCWQLLKWLTGTENCSPHRRIDIPSFISSPRQLFSDELAHVRVISPRISFGNCLAWSLDRILYNMITCPLWSHTFYPPFSALHTQPLIFQSKPNAPFCSLFERANQFWPLLFFWVA